MCHVGFRVLLVLYHYLYYKNDVILYDQSSSYPLVSILRNEFQALSLMKLFGLKVKKYKKTSRATSALDTSVVLESVLILNY